MDSFNSGVAYVGAYSASGSIVVEPPNLVERLQGIQKKVQPSLTRFGHPQFQKNLIVCRTKIESGSLTPIRNYESISPNPKIYSVPLRQVGMPLSDGTVMLGAEDIIVEMLSRSYPKEFFTEDVSFFLVESDRYKLIHIAEDGALNWKLILRKFNDRDSR